MKITPEELRKLLKYDPETGEFTWLVKRSNKDAGDIAGTINKLGYRQISIDYKLYTGHRLAWLYMTGSWPAACIDHINGNPADNRWCNLRQATMSENQHNRRKTKRNSSGAKGVTLCKATGKWVAQIMAHRKYHLIGRFSSLEKAKAAYEKAANRLHGEFARID